MRNLLWWLECQNWWNVKTIFVYCSHVHVFVMEIGTWTKFLIEKLCYYRFCSGDSRALWSRRWPPTTIVWRVSFYSINIIWLCVDYSLHAWAGRRRYGRTSCLVWWGRFERIVISHHCLTAICDASRSTMKTTFVWFWLCESPTPTNRNLLLEVTRTWKIK